SSPQFPAPVDLQPLKTYRASRNRAGLLRHDGLTLLVKCYAGERQQERRDCEELSLRAWSHAGFSVPVVRDVDVPELHDTPYLVMDYLPGLTLQEYLCQTDTPLSEKLALLSRIFRDNSRRHDCACRERQSRLLHPDPNSSNVICLGGQFYFIDFET